MLHPVSFVASFSAGFILSAVFALFHYRNPLPELSASLDSVIVIEQSIDVNRSHKGDRLLVRHSPDEWRPMIPLADFIAFGKGVSNVSVIDKTAYPPKLRSQDNEQSNESTRSKLTQNMTFSAELPIGCEPTLTVFYGQYLMHLIGRCFT